MALVNNPAWSDYLSKNPDYLNIALRDITTENFRTFLDHTGVTEGCRQYAAYCVPSRDKASFRAERNVFFLCNYIDDILLIVSEEGRKDLVEILLTEYEIPLDVYRWCIFGYTRWSKEGDIESFRRYFLTHPLTDIKGFVEKTIAKSGMTDVLDYLLSFENAEGEHVLHSDIMGWACHYRNVDILDRILTKNYSANATIRINGIIRYPVAIAVKHDNKDDFSIVDRLIMYGANFHVPLDRHDISVMNVALRFRDEAYLKRMLDIGITLQPDDYNNLYGLFLHAEGDLEVDTVVSIVKTCEVPAIRRKIFSALQTLQGVRETPWKTQIIERLRPLIEPLA
jgi:hypothetical protein